VVHRVRRGESLSIIARRYQTSVRAIMAMNGLRLSNFIRAGWKLKIPTGKRYEFAERVSPPMHKLEIKGEFIEYVVRKGDSLWKIANRFGTTAKIIQSVNQLNNTHLWIGQVLKIPKERIVDKNIKSMTHKVTRGDKLVIVANITLGKPFIIP